MPRYDLADGNKTVPPGRYAWTVMAHDGNANKTGTGIAQQHNGYWDIPAPMKVKDVAEGLRRNVSEETGWRKATLLCGQLWTP